MDNITMEMAENENVVNSDNQFLDGHLFAKMAQGGAAQLIYKQHCLFMNLLILNMRLKVLM